MGTLRSLSEGQGVEGSQCQRRWFHITAGCDVWTMQELSSNIEKGASYGAVRNGRGVYPRPLPQNSEDGPCYLTAVDGRLKLLAHVATETQGASMSTVAVSVSKRREGDS